MKMRVLIACEFSGTVRDAFRRKGHEAWSCDLLPTEGSPEYNQYHYQGDAVEIAYGLQWDLMIAHPPCTYLSLAGANRMYVDMKKEKGVDQDRLSKLRNGEDFFNKLLNCKIKKIAVENPLPNYKFATNIRRHDQIIHPYYFGDSVQKRTCLWLKNLPHLKVTNLVDKGELYIKKNGKSNGSKWFMYMPHKDRAKNRSKTFQGIAEAMADQWTQETINPTIGVLE